MAIKEGKMQSIPSIRVLDSWKQKQTEQDSVLVTSIHCLNPVSLFSTPFRMAMLHTVLRNIIARVLELDT